MPTTDSFSSSTEIYVLQEEVFWHGNISYNDDDNDEDDDDDNYDDDYYDDSCLEMFDSFSSSREIYVLQEEVFWHGNISCPTQS